MSAPKPRSVFGEAAVDRLVTELLANVGEDRNDDLIRKLVVTALDMDVADVDRLELKIASQTLAEMLNAYRVFSQHRGRSKVTVFGSARTDPSHPDFILASEFSAMMAARNWMIISGAGPGIMTAAIEGAGIENSFGVNIVLPFEQRAADIIEGDPKLATFRYFFTRKLFFMKETDGFALFPGGFGTLDEAFELLTLVQTGKSYPTPIVLLDHPESNYWSGWESFVDESLAGNGMVSDADTDLYLHTHDPAEAIDYLCRFYRTYHSIRFVRNRLVIRLRNELSAEAIATLNDEFADIIVKGQIEASAPTEIESKEDDHVHLPRLVMHFNNRSFARLTGLIHRINDLGPDGSDAPPSDQVHDVGPATEDEL